MSQVLNSRLEKTRLLNTKLAASLARLEVSGKSVQEAIGPIYGNTQKLQVLGTSTFKSGLAGRRTPLILCRHRWGDCGD